MRASLVAILMLGSSTAAAATKLCIQPRTSPAVAAPVDPTFIVERDRVAAFPVVRADGTLPHLRVTPLGAYWSRITVEAPAGTLLRIRRSCGSDMLRTEASWKRHDDAPNISARAASDGIELGFFWSHSERQSVRIDWALQARELVPATQGTMYFEASAMAAMAAWLPTTTELVHVRVTPVLLDGSEGTSWTGWIHRAPDGIRLGDGPAPVPDTSAACPTREPWVAGTNPTFTFRGHHRTFRAIAPDGRILPTMVAMSSEVTVATSHDFRLEVLPVGSACPLEVRVVEGRPLPRVIVSTASTTSNTAKVVLRVPVEPSVVVAYGATSWHGDATMRSAKVVLALEAHDWGAFETPPETLRIVLAPERSGFVGRSCELWLSRTTGRPIVAPVALEHERCDVP